MPPGGYQLPVQSVIGHDDVGMQATTYTPPRAPVAAAYYAGDGPPGGRADGKRGRAKGRWSKGGGPEAKGKGALGKDAPWQPRAPVKGKGKDWRLPPTPPHLYSDGTPDATSRVWDLYILETDNRGRTLMWHGLPSRCSAESDLLQRLYELRLLDRLQYLYMPVDTDNQFRMNGSRGKGYAFLHFFDPGAVEEMLRRTEAGLDVSSRKETSVSVASYQGISANLYQILASPMIMSMKGFFFARVAGRLEKIYIQELQAMHVWESARARGAARRRADG
jgi:hypothetical protein